MVGVSHRMHITRMAYVWHFLKHIRNCLLPKHLSGNARSMACEVAAAAAAAAATAAAANGKETITRRQLRTKGSWEEERRHIRRHLL